MFFILTYSRSLSAEQTRLFHREIAEQVEKSANGRLYLLVSRGDSALRGHYPLEPKALRDTLEACGRGRFDGEIVFPLFPEGGRYIIDGVHYVLQQEGLVPAGETEFAQDRTLEFRSSKLDEWIEEKTKGVVPAVCSKNSSDAASYAPI